MTTSFFWFRRDLRLDDNTGLYHALKENDAVQPVFIFDTNILSKLKSDDQRVTFIYKTIAELKAEIQKNGSDLWVFYGDPESIWETLIKENPSSGIYTNHDYEPYGMKRDTSIQALCMKNKICFKTYKDQVIFEKNEVTKDDGLPYTVFTPYSRKWKARYTSFPPKIYNTDSLLKKFTQSNQKSKMPKLIDMHFEFSTKPIPDKTTTVELIQNYNTTRDFPGQLGTSRLGVHFRFGTISIREWAQSALQLNETFLNELIWRDFYMTILWHFPHVVDRSFRPKYDAIPWKNNPEYFQSWCEGKTGYPIVDAGMRELNETGYMHNRVRMIVASFLCKHLLIDWRWGEKYFAEKLIDFELASNNGGWQWAAGTGCDAAPYFRVFSPDAQTKKFDPDYVYINKWVKDINELTYPHPIVEHKIARLKAIETYKQALV